MNKNKVFRETVNGEMTEELKNEKLKCCVNENEIRIAVHDTTWLYCRKCGKKL
jgi:hypothetical protein